jgi:hypothetical protein
MPYTTAELEAFLSESLPPAIMAAIEQALRGDKELTRRLAAIHARQLAGVVSVGEIWRRERLTCASRDQLGSYLLGTLDDAAAAYLKLHIEVVGCRYCQANLADLQNQQAEQPAAAETRRRKYFQSSVGRLT